MPDVRDFSKLPGYMTQEQADALSMASGGGRDAITQALMQQQHQQPMPVFQQQPADQSLGSYTAGPGGAGYIPQSGPMQQYGGRMSGPMQQYGGGMPDPMQQYGGPMPSWFQGGRGAFNRMMRNFDGGGGFNPFAQSDGGGGGGGSFGGGVFDGGGGPPGGGSNTPGGGGNTPGGGGGSVIGADLSGGPGAGGGQGSLIGGQIGTTPIDFSGMQFGTPGAPGAPNNPANNPFEFFGPQNVEPLTSVPQTNLFEGRPGSLLEALQSLNQAPPQDLQGAFSTAGMSLADLADAWGVSLDSAQALADAGFADLSGGGFGGFGDSGGYGDSGGGGPGSGDDPGGGGDPGDDF
jgi:hypothetical protein